MTNDRIAGELMQVAGSAITGIAILLRENAVREAIEGAPFLNGFTAGALYSALELIGDRLSIAGDPVEQEGAADE